MMRKATIALIVSLLPLAAYGQSVKLPATISGETNDYITIRADTDSPVVKWYILDPGLKLFPMELLKDSKVAVVHSSKVGKYRIIAWCAKGDVPSEAAVCTVVIGDSPPDPTPVPPKPPTPPVPPPVPPTPPKPPTPPPPTDDLAKKIIEAFAADKSTDAEKKAAAISMQALDLELATKVKDKSFATVGAFLSAYRLAAAKMVDSDVLIQARKIAAAEVFAAFPSDAEAALDDAGRDKASALFTRLAAIWGGLR